MEMKVSKHYEEASAFLSPKGLHITEWYEDSEEEGWGCVARTGEGEAILIVQHYPISTGEIFWSVTPCGAVHLEKDNASLACAYAAVLHELELASKILKRIAG